MEPLDNMLQGLVMAGCRTQVLPAEGNSDAAQRLFIMNIHQLFTLLSNLNLYLAPSIR